MTLGRGRLTRGIGVAESGKQGTFDHPANDADPLLAGGKGLRNHPGASKKWRRVNVMRVGSVATC
jgi:hypothetical protein